MYTLYDHCDHCGCEMYTLYDHYSETLETNDIGLNRQQEGGEAEKDDSNS